MFSTDDQNSKDMPEKFRMTDIHTDEVYSSKIEQCIRDIDTTGKEDMKITQQMKSEETPDSTTDNQNLFCSSMHEAVKSEDNCSAKQDVVSESITFRNNVTGDLLCFSKHEAAKSKYNCSANQDVVSESITFRNNVTGDLLCSSKHEAVKSEDNCSAKQGVVSESITFQNNVTGDMFQCKYCTEESKDKDCLITPCRCSGSLRYVHKHCLETWIRVRSKETCETELRCELCGYRFYRQKHHKWTRFSCSELSLSDRRLYYAGIVCMFMVVGSVSALVFCFIQDSPFVKKYVESKIDKLVASSANTNEINRALEPYSLSTLDNMKIVCAVVLIIFIILCVFLAKVCKVPPHKLILGHTNERWAALPYSASRDSLVVGNVTNV